MEKELAAHEALHPKPVITRMNGEVIPEGFPVNELTISGGVQELSLHPDAPPAKKTG